MQIYKKKLKSTIFFLSATSKLWQLQKISFESASLRDAVSMLLIIPTHKMELLPSGRDPILCGVIESVPLRGN